MAKDNLYLGKKGEEEAHNWLRKEGYKVLARNYKTRLGEIDIIAKDKDTVCFIEVKARGSDRFGLPQEAVSRAKQDRIARVAMGFLKENNLLTQEARFDIVSVIYSKSSCELELIKNAFELDRRFAY